MSTQKLPKDIWAHIRSFSDPNEPTPTATIIKDLHFCSDHGVYHFSHGGRDGDASTVVFVLHAHLKKISRCNFWGDHAYRTTPVDYLRFVHIDRDAYAIKVSEFRFEYPD